MTRSASFLIMQIVLMFILSPLSDAKAETYSLITLQAFHGSNGRFADAGLVVDANGNFYGRTYFGGPQALGTVFKIDRQTNQLTTLVTLDGTNGAHPTTDLTIDAAGNLYFATSSTNYDKATVFKIPFDTNILTPIATFDQATSGVPVGKLAIDTNGNIFGTLSGTGLLDGSVFKVSAGTNEVISLATFNGNNGGLPTGGLVASPNGYLYGTTFNGGNIDSSDPTGLGTVFRIDPNSHELTTIVAFNGVNGKSPWPTLTLDGDGNLYGTTYGGANSAHQSSFNYGTVFKIDGITNELTTLIEFKGYNGHNPTERLFLDPNGNIYGTAAGPINSHTEVFKILAGTNDLITIADFSGINGDGPSELIMDANGNLFGTTSGAGPFNMGTVFELRVVPETSSLLLVGSIAVCGFCLRHRLFHI